VDDYNRAIKLSPNNPDAFLWRGEAYSKLHEYNKAFDDFNAALELNPNLTEAHVKRAEAFQLRDNNGDNEQAITELTQAINQIPYDPKVYIRRGEAYIKSRKREQAIADYERARDLSEREQKNDEVNKTAKLWLQKLNPKPTSTDTPPTMANPKIYLQYRDPKDFPMLNRIALALRKRQNFTVADNFALVTKFTAGDVRYFYNEDEATAQTIKEIVEDTLKNNRIDQSLELKLFKNLSDGVSQGLIEVWLPSLPSPSSRNQNPFYQQKSKAQAQ
jgi:tetratricopeptide (TPR) repeat protein